MDNDDKTVVMPGRPAGGPGSIEPVAVRFLDPQGREQVRQFTAAFVIGREIACQVRLGNDIVSRRHAEVTPRQGGWWLIDLESANGTYINGARIQEHRLERTTEIELGKQGPVVRLEVAVLQPDKPEAAGTNSAADDVRRYVDPTYSGPMGDHTHMVRRAISQSRKQQSRNYLYVIGLVSLAMVGALGYALYQQFRLERLESLTVDIFYNMKEMELQVARLEGAAAASGDRQQVAELAEMRARVKVMESRYDTYLDEVGLLKQEMTEEDRLIFKVARIFGECEVTLPEEFAKEVKRYIAKWQTTDRLASAIKRARLNGYTPIVQEAMLQHYLPPQFFYLALKESEFKRGIVGPQTRYGIAKGIWQFIPATARRYGLETGPLLELRRFDPKDERFNFNKATMAAASYLRDIYTTEAQASGLLVMASYNWGENRVRKLLRQMPENPRQRNFWELIKRHDIPEETYNYVYYIFAAAVIGENPRLFGFDFDNPLTTAKQAAAATPLPFSATSSEQHSAVASSPALGMAVRNHFLMGNATEIF